METNGLTRSLFTYPGLTGLVEISTEDVELFFNEQTRFWLEKVLNENYSDGIKRVSPYRIRPWSQVFTVETIRGGFYFLKIPATEFYQEAKIIELIENLGLDITVCILARNKINGAFLMDALEGDTLRTITRKQLNESIFEDSAVRIAEFQKSARDHVSDFEKVGIPKWTAKTILKDCEILINHSRYLSHSGLSSKSISEFRSLLPAIYEKLSILSGFDKGLSIDHGDFQDNNIFVSKDRVFFMDWGDVNISIPSFTIGTYCHSILLAHANISNKPKLVRNILSKYYFNLLGFEYDKLHQCHVSLVHILYPISCILKVGRLFNADNKKLEKYASTIIDYWIGIVISFSDAYHDESLSNEIT